MLEQRIKEVETEMRNLGASRKDIHEVYSEGVQLFFWKARRWRSEDQENNLLQKIEEEDMRRNEDLCARRMETSYGMDKIWERSDKKFLAEPRNRIHRLDKARFEKWAKGLVTHILLYKFRLVNVSCTIYIKREERQMNFTM